MRIFSSPIVAVVNVLKITIAPMGLDFCNIIVPHGLLLAAPWAKNDRPNGAKNAHLFELRWPE